MDFYLYNANKLVNLARYCSIRVRQTWSNAFLNCRLRHDYWNAPASLSIGLANLRCFEPAHWNAPSPRMARQWPLIIRPFVPILVLLLGGAIRLQIEIASIPIWVMGEAGHGSVRHEELQCVSADSPIALKRVHCLFDWEIDVNKRILYSFLFYLWVLCRYSSSAS